MSTTFCPNCGTKFKNTTYKCSECNHQYHANEVIKTDFKVHDMVEYKGKKLEITDIFLNDDTDIIIELEFGFAYVTENEIL